VLAGRARTQRNFLATLLLSQGVPMLAHGDELGRTQQGNNNTYAQDSELSWVHWDDADKPLVEFTAAVSRLRAEHPTFRRKRFFTGAAVRVGERLNDIVWLHPDGRPMVDGDWGAPDARALGMYLNGQGIAGRDATGNRIIDEHALLYFNGGFEPIQVCLPPKEYADAWAVAVETAADERETRPLKAGSTRELAAHSVLVLIQHTGETTEPALSAAASVAVMAKQASEAATPAEAPGA
jgi:glycogen operon protein